MIFKIFFFLPFHSVVFCWFGTVYSALAVIFAKILGKKAFIVLGGMDSVKIPELNYGIWMSPWKSKLMSFAYRRTSRLLAVSPTFKTNIRQLAGYDGENTLFIPTAYDTEFWRPAGKKENQVLTVAHSGFHLTTEEALRRFCIKGLDWLFSAAALLSDYRFVVVGFSDELLKQMRITVPSNINTIDFVPYEQLAPFYQNAKVYCQPSLSEGMPNTLCEAMSCGCIPVGSDVGAISHVIGDTGFVVPYGQTDRLTESITKAMNLPSDEGLKARDRIMKHFLFSHRRKALLDILGISHP